MNCSQCGTEITLNAKFCSNCGIAVEVTEAKKPIESQSNSFKSSIESECASTPANPKLWFSFWNENKLILAFFLIVVVVGVIFLITNIPIKSPKIAGLNLKTDNKSNNIKEESKNIKEIDDVYKFIAFFKEPINAVPVFNDSDTRFGIDLFTVLYQVELRQAYDEKKQELYDIEGKKDLFSDARVKEKLNDWLVKYKPKLLDIIKQKIPHSGNYDKTYYMDSLQINFHLDTGYDFRKGCFNFIFSISQKEPHSFLLPFCCNIYWGPFPQLKFLSSECPNDEAIFKFYEYRRGELCMKKDDAEKFLENNKNNIDKVRKLAPFIFMKKPQETMSISSIIDQKIPVEVNRSRTNKAVKHSRIIGKNKPKTIGEDWGKYPDITYWSMREINFKLKNSDNFFNDVLFPLLQSKWELKNCKEKKTKYKNTRDQMILECSPENSTNMD